MKAFKKNIISVYGRKGKDWLLDLDRKVQILQKHWQLSQISPVENMTYNYVAKAVNPHNIPVVLKIVCDEKCFLDEINALKHFNGKGSIDLIDFYPEYQALLLQQAIPGTSLKSFYPEKIDFVMDAYVSVVKRIHNHPLPEKGKFSFIDSWLEALDRVKLNKIPKPLIDKALQLKNNLLRSMKDIRLLHGDLHLENILQNGNEWLCIDPKGVLGEIAFEIAAFDFLDQDEINKNASAEFNDRIGKIASKAGLSFQRVKDWVFVRLILSAAWFIEDKQDPSKPLKLVELLNID